MAHHEEVHTLAGHHELCLERWALWAERAGCAATLTAAEGARELEAALLGLGGTTARLPWEKLGARHGSG